MSSQLFPMRREPHVSALRAAIGVVLGLCAAAGTALAQEPTTEMDEVIDDHTWLRGEFIETVCGLPGARCEIVGLNLPGGGTWLELARFVRPDHEPGSPDAKANELGIRNVCYEVDDIEAAVEAAAALGYGLVGGIGEFENSWKMTYVRGPDGIVVSVTQAVG